MAFALNRIILVIIGIVAAGSAGFFLFGNSEPETSEPETAGGIPAVVNVGLLLPATGDIASHGVDNIIASRLGAADFNAYLRDSGEPWQVNLVNEDTQTDPAIALEKIQSLNSKGIKLILGTETSAELLNIKSYADSNNMLLISPSSTTPKLAIQDNIFRLIPDDTKQAVVIAELLKFDGIRVIVPVYRGDVWGDGPVRGRARLL